MPILRLLINQFVKGFADHKFCSLFSKEIHFDLILIQNSQTSDTFETMIFSQLTFIITSIYFWILIVVAHDPALNFPPYFIHSYSVNPIISISLFSNADSVDMEMHSLQ